MASFTRRSARVPAIHPQMPVTAQYAQASPISVSIIPTSLRAASVLKKGLPKFITKLYHSAFVVRHRGLIGVDSTKKLRKIRTSQAKKDTTSQKSSTP